MMPLILPQNPTLLTLASRQIWPQVLAVLHLRPARVVLLHSENRAESKDPAQRLKRFFDASGLVPKGGTKMEEIPYHDFEGIVHRLETLEVDSQRSLLHFTGGNKLMATAAFQWASRRHIPSFYLERGSRLIWFFPNHDETSTREESLDGHVADALDPLDLLRCQIEASELERKGQLLGLSARGAELSLEEISARCAQGEDLRGLLSIEDRTEGDRFPKEGDRLEYNTAVVLLKLGVHRIRRSLRLKVKSAMGVSTALPHEEIDLLFNFGGRLWLVDCKDKRPTEELVDALEDQFQRNRVSMERFAGLLARIRDELSIGQLKALKLDLLSIQDAGGLLGRTICVRRSALPAEVVEYARRKGIDLVRSSDLADGLRALLGVNMPASSRQLSRLQEKFAQQSHPHPDG